MGAVGVKALVRPFFCYATATKTAIANTTATATTTATKTATATHDRNPKLQPTTATKTATRKPPLFISNIKTGQSYDQVRRDHYQTY